jgi:aspartate 1-decarboxylase
MMRFMMKSKIHRARVTESNMDYEGSITIDEALMQEADILPYEQVDVYNISNGERFTTYAMKGERDSGIICVNGAAAHKAKKGDIIIIVSYGTYKEEEIVSHQPKKVYVDERNRPIVP